MYITGVACSIISTPLHSQIDGNPTAAVYEDVLLITCDVGYYFPTLNTNTITLTCQGLIESRDGAWDNIDDIEDCSRKSIVNSA